MIVSYCGALPQLIVVDYASVMDCPS